MKQRKTINRSFAIMCVLVILITNVICTSAVTQEQLPPRKETKEVETDVDKKTTKDVVEEPVETIEEEIVEEVGEDVIPYTDLVYCVELPKYHTLWVMRNGKTSWNGNCRCTAMYNYD